ncbi:hypothetical protein L249_0490 [Ophiocordyceps polyrhachis-furcata BCC 54312]|uniref:Secreted protein n=1 Tax=Ophiocordyceps polyrhachis-furcata BCC 54312 TaxID=1330021 RepID=A0A367LCZ3_9HYPO|nr:hypothetical protein L249_0490 [Ophiocordyceps polyrhachis-furcata BCC 54312]
MPPPYWSRHMSTMDRLEVTRPSSSRLHVFFYKFTTSSTVFQVSSIIPSIIKSSTTTKSPPPSHASNMLFIAALAPLLGFALAAPQEGPKSVKVRGISLLGSGCPKGSADVQVDSSGSLFEATFSEYQVSTGPGTRAVDWRKNCKLTINMDFTPGYSFSIVETDTIGFAEIPAGARGQCVNTFSFTGQGNHHVDYKLDLKGKYSGNFDLQSRTGLESFSPCGGGSAILNLNTACAITPTNLPALISVDHLSGKLKVKFALKWRFCGK